MNKYMRILLSIPKCIFLNLAIFGLKDGFKLPVLIGYDVKIGDIHKNCIELNQIKFGTVSIGLEQGSVAGSNSGGGISV